MAMRTRRICCGTMPHFATPGVRASSTDAADGTLTRSGDGQEVGNVVPVPAPEPSKSKAGSDDAAKLTINIKTAIREFRLGDIPNAKVCGLPTERSLFTVIQGPHIDKKSREQFDVQTRKWRITIDTETSKLRDKLEFLKEHRIPGVEIKARFQYKTRLSWPLKPTSLSDQDKWKLLKLRKKNPKLYTAAKLADEFNIEQEQVYDVLRSMEERQKHVDMFGE